MAKRTGPVASSGGHFTNKKGDKKRGAPPGNTNTANGPRLGRQGKETTPLPQPRPDAKLPRRRRRAKTGGRNFVKGQNSHDGEVFRRTEDQLPRGNTLLMGKIIFHDARKELYDQIRAGIRKSPAFAFAFWRDITDRTEGLPTKRIEKTTRREATFVFTTKDGEIPALPSRELVGRSVSPTAVSAEELMTLDLQPVRP